MTHCIAMHIASEGPVLLNYGKYPWNNFYIKYPWNYAKYM